MPGLGSLPPDQRAVVSLVLEKGRGYAQIATLLKLDEQAVRERAHAALDALGPRGGTPPPAPRRAEISDYLLGQQTPEEAERTRGYLSDAASGRAWARVVAGELRGLAAAELPEIPGEGTVAAPAASGGSAAATAAPAAPAAAAATPGASSGGGGAAGPASSRRGGAILLGALATIAVIVLIVVLVTSGGGSSHRSAPAASVPTSNTTTTPTRIVAQINLTAPNHAKSPIGVATLVQQGSTEGIAIQAAGLTATSSHLAYAVWLYNSHSSAERIGFAPPVTSNGRLGAIAPAPSNLSQYRAILLTRESSAQATRPGPTVLAGALPGHSLKP